MEDGSSRKQLPLRQQTDKPMLRYSSPGVPVQLFSPSQVASYRGGSGGDKVQYPLSLFLQRSEPQISPQAVHKTNPYARPTSAQDVEAKMTGGANRSSTGKSNLSSSSGSSVASTGSNTSLSAMPSPPSGGSVTSQNPPLQTNSFLRPRSALNKQNSSDSFKETTPTGSGNVDSPENVSSVGSNHCVGNQRISESTLSSTGVYTHSHSDPNVAGNDLSQLKARNTNLMKHFNKLVDSNRNFLRENHITGLKTHSSGSGAANLKDSKSTNSISTSQQSIASGSSLMNDDKETGIHSDHLTGRYILYTSFTRPAPNGINGAKESQYILAPGGGGRAAPPAHKPPIPLRRPPANFTEALNRIEPRPPSDSRPSSTSSSTSSGPASAAAEAAAKVRNLNYTPTKPYHEVNHVKPPPADTVTTVDNCIETTNQKNQLNDNTKKHLSPNLGHMRNKSLITPAATPISNTLSPPGNHNDRTQYYYKGSKAEQKVARSPRPKTEGALKKTSVTDDGDKTDNEWEDMDTDSDDDDDDGDDDQNMDLRPDSERVPGDGEDERFPEDDDDDDIMDDLADDVLGDSDDESDCYSIKTSVSSRASTVCTRSTTQRLSKMSLSGRRSVTAVSRSPSATTLSSDEKEPEPALCPSLFTDVPPTINFVLEGNKVEQMPWDIRKLLKWRMSPITPNIVKATIARSNFRASKKNHDWLGYWGKHMKAQGFKAIREYQKVNHFPGSFQIGRKDRLWRNLSRMQVHFGKKEFSFFPQTFCLPYDLKLLKRVWEDGGSKQKWIIKPPASARGIGIKVIHKWTQIPKRRPVIVQKYLAHPYLINGSKFDLRIYVYIPSYDPLRLYVYEDGLVRFASAKYSSSLKSLNNKYMHLTNYSINKKNNEYESNADESLCQGHKWGLKALWGYLRQRGVNTTQVWDNIKDVIAKTCISVDSCISSMIKSNCRSRYVCHELFGFDIMLDENLKPWIIEVNISPSLHSNSKLDINIKGGMIRDLMNICGFQLPNRRDLTNSTTESVKHNVPADLCMDKRLFPSQFSPDERAKHAYFSQRHTDQYVQSTILDIFTPADVRMLVETLDEDSRRGNFQRVIPSHKSHKYLQYFEHPRYFNLLLDQWFSKYHRMEARGIAALEAICQRGIHLEHPTEDPRHQWSPPSTNMHDSRSFSVLNKEGSRSSSVLPHVRKRRAGQKNSLSSNSAGPTPRSSRNTEASPLTNPS